MTTIQLSERGRNPDGSCTVRVVFDDGAEYDVTVTDLADPAEEQELAWYFEEHLRFPFLDQDRERRAVRHIAEYGQTLFAQVFGGAVHHDYRRLRDRAFDGCRLEVSGSAAFHRLHWEALRDPELDAPLAVRLPITRRVERVPLRFELPPERETLNILVVTARPDGPTDVGYRTISRPLLDSLRQADLPVAVDLVRPGTWEELRAHLRSATERHGSGWYQVVHFDLHGAFGDAGWLEQGHRSGRLVFQASEPERFDGKRGFLFFETSKDGRAEPVSAGAIASLLAEHRVPVAVLNACQSAMQTASEASLAQNLVEAGVPVAVGMAYSVTVSAAERAMPVLYGRLARGADPVAGVHAVRRELFQHRARQAYFDQQLDLEDWMLPVMFGQRPVQLRLREMTGEEECRFLQREVAVGDEPRTEYGFVGRDLDIQAIERRLLIGGSPNQLLVQGMAGAGKSTLLHHLGWWWQRTGLVEQVFRFSYEDRAWTTGQMLREIGATLLDRVEQARLDALPDDAQLERVARLLRAHRHLLVIDNAESITASPAAIPHALSEPEQQRLGRLLARLRGGRTLVLLGSRQDEAWLAADSFGSNVYPLPGLDPQAASVLVERILRNSRATRHLDDPAERTALDDMVRLLGGYPLPLTVVLPVLETSTPSTVLAELRAGDPAPDPVGRIRQAIEYSHGKLDPTIQNSLLLLVPFLGIIGTGPALDVYGGLLLEDETVRGLGEIDLDAAVRQAVAVGLATPHPQLSASVQVQPVLPYFLRNRLKDQPDLLAAAVQAHYRLYVEFGGVLHGLLVSREAPERAIGQAATRAEYANLTAALDHGLQTRQRIGQLIEPLHAYLDQTKQQIARRQLLDHAIAACANATGPEEQFELAFLHELAGATALAQHRLQDAKSHYENSERLYNDGGNRQMLGAIYHQLGMIAQEQRRYDEAEAHYRHALDIKLEFNDHHSASTSATRLGILLAQLKRNTEAAGILLYAAVSWYRVAGNWSDDDLVWLKRVRQAIGADAFSAEVRAHVPDDLVEAIIVAIGKATDVGEAGRRRR